MTVGTKSLLIGAHWPPHMLMVVLAWKWLYGTWPSLKEMAAIAIHDIGYVGCKDMDGEQGNDHPELGAKIADHFLGVKYGDLIRGHSKGYARSKGYELSKLYGPDKLSHAFEPLWLYPIRTRLTSELRQYRYTNHGVVRQDDPTVSDKEWFRAIRMLMALSGIQQTIDASVPKGFGEGKPLGVPE